MYTTNYYDTFITVADDCPITHGEIPPIKENRSVANIEYDLIAKNPYKYTSDDVLFAVYAEKKDLIKEEFEEERVKMFSKGQACMRASPLTKRYGWGVHFNNEGKIALFDSESVEYKKLKANKNIKVIKAVRFSKA